MIRPSLSVTVVVMVTFPALSVVVTVVVVMPLLSVLTFVVIFLPSFTTVLVLVLVAPATVKLTKANRMTVRMRQIDRMFFIRLSFAADDNRRPARPEQRRRATRPVRRSPG